MDDEVRVKKHFLIFTKTGKSFSGLTDIWTLQSQSGVDLGQISWKAEWRRYVFFSAKDAYFDEGCLRDIADFVEALSVAHRKAGLRT